MDLKKLNEEYRQVINETQIEHVDLVAAVKEGNYDGEDIDEIVLDNLDQFSIDDLVNIFNNPDYYRHGGADNLFPSGWNYKHAGNEYPIKLAEAVAKCNDKEVITEIYNIYYRCHGDLTTWGQASKVWQDAMLSDNKNLDTIIKACKWDNSFYNTVTEELLDNKEMIDFVAKLEKALEEYKPEFMARIKKV